GRVGTGVEDRQSGDRILDDPCLKFALALASRLRSQHNAAAFDFGVDRVSRTQGELPHQRTRNYKLPFCRNFRSHGQPILRFFCREISIMPASPAPTTTTLLW